MNFSRIIRRSFEITWDYRALWVFGFILALTRPSGGGNGGGGGGGGGGSSFTAPAGLAAKINLPLLQMEDGAVVALAVAMACLGLLIALIFSAARVVAETALIRMVDGYEETGTRVSVGQGFRLGWSRGAWRMFLIDLLVTLAAVLVVIALLAFAAAPLILWTLDSDALGGIGTAITVLLSLPVIMIIIVGMIALVILIQFFHRAAVLEDRGVFEAFSRGWQVARLRLGEVLLMALILFAIGLAAVLVLLPLFFVLLVAGGTLAGLPGLLVGLFTSLFAGGPIPWILGLLIAAPIFFILVILPSLFASGLFQVYTSSAWTLTYREILSTQQALQDPSG